MPVRTMHNDQSSLYYITFTCFNWLPLFQLTNSYDMVYNWFEYLKTEKNIKTTAYVHAKSFACILFFSTPDFSLNKIISNAKRLWRMKWSGGVKRCQSGIDTATITISRT